MFVKIISSSERSRNDVIFLQKQRDVIEIDFEVQIPPIEMIAVFPECQVKIEHIDVEEYLCKDQSNNEENQGINEYIETPNEIEKTEASRDEDVAEDEEMHFDDDNNMESCDDHVSGSDTESESANKQTAAKREHPSGSQVHHCSICNKTYKNRKALSRHTRNIHHEKRQKFHCSECAKCFATSNRLHRHEKIHLPDELRLVHPCDFCDKRFPQLTNLKVHILHKHSPKRSFICEECGKTFVTNTALKEHQVVHSDEHPFECEKCPKKFKTKAMLCKHGEIHSGTSYECVICHLQLKTRTTLRRHLAVHSDEKKYKCQYCGNDYKRAKTLKTHLILHTGSRPYACPFCEKTFVNGSNFRTHKKKAHPEELAPLEATGFVLPATALPKLKHLQPKIPANDEN